MKRTALFSLLLVSLWTPVVQAQQEAVYMAVLSTFRTVRDPGTAPGFGLFVSCDAGLSWKHRGWRDYIRTFYTEAGADGTIWSACGNGVLRSTDNGRRWRVTTGWEVTEALKVKAAPSLPSLVFASTAYGIFRSTNSGASWEKTTHGMRRPFSGDVCIDRTDPFRVIAATEEGVYLSENQGGLWRRTGLAGKGVRVVLQDPHDPARFWLGSEEDGVFCSVDAGNRWEQKSQGPGAVYTIAVHPQKVDWIYAGTFGEGVLLSTDRGGTWVARSRGLADPHVHALVVLPSDPRIILAGTLNRGLFRSTDGGETWSHSSHDSSQVWGLSVQTDEQDHINAPSTP